MVKKSKAMLSTKTFNGQVGKNPQYVLFTCSFCLLKGKLIDVGERFGLQNRFVKTKWIIV